ncbi:MAG: hypothetical protein KDN05_22580, partial [Verrucomicrobiae bacterium]|nr:hypothetical protein [Verrucomicrobiae bacterium]
FLREYYGPEPSMTPDQTIHAIAIDWGILPETMRDEAAGRLAGLVNEAGGHFMTGVFGMPSLWPSLVGHGHQATAWKALQNETHPSFNHLASKGATTFWEVWPGQMDPRDPARPYSRSMSHPFQAAFVQWFYSGLAGIRPDPEKPGFRSILLEPQMIDGLDEVECSFDSAMGGIESSWKRDGNNFTWNIVIPPGATAKVRLPGRLKGMDPPSDTFSFSDANDAQGAAQRATLPAGRYRLVSTLP